MAGFALFLMTVLIWGSTWIAIEGQAGPVAPQVSVAYRFLLAGAVLLAWCLLLRRPLGYRWRQHGWIALQGLCLFCLNYIPLYWASHWLTSGLVAVGFSSVVIFSIVFSAIAFRRPIEARVLAGGGLGIAGLAVIFQPELAADGVAGTTLLGLGLTIVAALLAAFGTVLGSRNQRAGLPIMQTNGFGMVYGGLACALIAVASGDRWIVDLSAHYLGSLAYLVLFGSVIGFWGYLTTVGRLGPERAAFIPVLFPCVALAISSLVEGFAWTPSAIVGLALVLLGNALALVRPPRLAMRARRAGVAG